MDNLAYFDAFTQDTPARHSEDSGPVLTVLTLVFIGVIGAMLTLTGPVSAAMQGLQLDQFTTITIGG